MRRIVFLATLLALAPGPLTAQDAAAYIIRLGSDTIGLERSVRTATQVTGESVLRSPAAVHTRFTAELGADGWLRRYEVVTRRIAGQPGPVETRSTVELRGDSAIITVPRGTSEVTLRLGEARHAALWLGYNVAMLEQFARQGLAAGMDSFPVLTAGPARGAGTVTRGTGDSLLAAVTLPIGRVGPVRVVLDAQGRVTYLTAVGTPLQIVVERVPSVDIAAATASFASRPVGALSPRDTALGIVGGAEVSVQYSRPSRRGREIFGRVVPWDVVWRTGANAATHFQTPVDLTIGDMAVPAGTYTLWTLPSASGWKLILNRQTGQWGTDYHADRDLGRVDLRRDTLAEPMELMTIAIETRGSQAVLSIAWDRTRVWVPIARR